MLRFFFIVWFVLPLIRPLGLSASVPTGAKNRDKIQAQVGAEIISSIDLNSFKNLLAQDLSAESVLDSLFPKKALLKDRALSLEALILRKMIAQQIPSEFSALKETDFKNLLQSQQKALGKKSFLNKIRQAGWSLESYKSFLKETLKIHQFLNWRLLSKVSVSDQDLESAYLKKYKKALFQEFEYEFLSLTWNEEQRPAVVNYLQKTKKPDLTLLAQQEQLELKKSKLKGSQIKPEIKQELDKLSVSQVSPILFIDSLYYLLQIQWKSPLISQAEQEKKQELEKKLYERAFNRELELWIEEQKKQVFIKRFPL